MYTRPILSLSALWVSDKQFFVLFVGDLTQIISNQKNISCAADLLYSG